MILELDVGNTRVKWRLLHPDLAIAARGVDDFDAWLAGSLPAAWDRDITRIRAASVVGSALETQLESAVGLALGAPVEFAVADAYNRGLRNAYAEPALLGVDRWLALLAAFNQFDPRESVLVADIGSALTIDLADEQGQHRGGYIIPGPLMMQRSLLRDTQKVRFESTEALASTAFGENTASCVAGGLVAAQAGSVLVALHAARDLIGGTPHLFITGGWASVLGEALQALGVKKFCVAPDLVLDGLRWSLP